MHVLLLLALVIRALLPVSDDIQRAAELLREAAKAAGCAEPVVAMRWRGDERGIEVEVTCREEERR